MACSSSSVSEISRRHPQPSSRRHDSPQRPVLRENAMYAIAVSRLGPAARPPKYAGASLSRPRTTHEPLETKVLTLKHDLPAISVWDCPPPISRPKRRTDRVCAPNQRPERDHHPARRQGDEFHARHYGRRDRARDRTGSGARRADARGRRQAVGSVPPDRARREDPHHYQKGCRGARADPPRRRACARDGGAGSLSRHAGDHRSRDRGRLLLRLRARDPVHAGGPAQDRREDARDHQARSSDPPPRCGRATRRWRISRAWARPTRPS